jgi:SAM-dependent methyltransferase
MPPKPFADADAINREAPMSGNDDQIAYWNAEVGERWTANQERLDALIAPFGVAAMDAARVAAGERVIDIGCGCGDTTIALAGAVGPGGHVLGVDVSAPMLARAKQRAAGLGNVAFVEADAAAGALPSGFDVLFSRFGVMFFADPPAAFAALRRSLKPDGRIAFACWRAVAENPWMTVPLMAGIAALGASPPPPTPRAPGPFAFAEAAWVREILDRAGFRDADIAAFDAPMTLGADADAAASMALEVGPLGALVREHGAAAAERVKAAVAAALAGHMGPTGVTLTGAVWIVTAHA